jgi:hypothetical protein
MGQRGLRWKDEETNKAMLLTEATMTMVHMVVTGEGDVKMLELVEVPTHNKRH